MRIINATPHVVRTMAGGFYKPSYGTVARVTTELVEAYRIGGEIIFQRQDTLNLPKQRPQTTYIVSSVTLAVAKKQGRTDCISPAVFHKDTVRNRAGHVVCVPGFIN